MTLVQKMLQDNGIKPADTSDVNGQKLDPNGKESGASEVLADDNTVIKPDTDANISIPATKPAADVADADTEPDEAALVQMLAKKGIKISSLKDLEKPADEIPLTDDQKAAAEQKRQNAIRSFALSTGKVTTTLLDNYIRESGKPAPDIAFSLYKAERLADEKEAGTKEMPTDKDLQEEFDELYFQHADATDPRRKAAEKRMQAMADSHLANKYEKIYTLEDDYNDHLTTTEQRKSYDSEVSQAVTSLGDTLAIEITDDNDQKVTYTVKFNQAEKKAIQDIYTADSMFNSIGGKAKKEQIVAAMKDSLKSMFFDRFVADVARAHATAKTKGIKMGRREIFSDTNITDKIGDKKVTPMVKKILDRNKQTTKQN